MNKATIFRVIVRVQRGYPSKWDEPLQWIPPEMRDRLWIWQGYDPEDNWWHPNRSGRMGSKPRRTKPRWLINAQPVERRYQR